MRAALQFLDRIRDGNRSVFETVHLADRIGEDRLTFAGCFLCCFRGVDNLADDVRDLRDAG